MAVAFLPFIYLHLSVKACELENMQTAHLKVLLDETISLRLFSLQVVAKHVTNDSVPLNVTRSSILGDAGADSRDRAKILRTKSGLRKFTRRGERLKKLFKRFFSRLINFPQANVHRFRPFSTI